MSEPTNANESPSRAKIFWNGGSQAVRLPKEFRFRDDEVLIHRHGEAVVLEPIPKRDWPDDYWSKLDKLRDGVEIPDIEPIGARLLDLEVPED